MRNIGSEARWRGAGDRQGLTSVTSRIHLVRLKIERAKKHIRDADVACNFYATDPYVVVPKRDPKTREVSFYLAHVDDVPVGISAIAGDAIHNLRSALDYLAYQLVAIAAGQTPPNFIYFPVAENGIRVCQLQKKSKGHEAKCY